MKTYGNSSFFLLKLEKFLFLHRKNSLNFRLRSEKSFDSIIINGVRIVSEREFFSKIVAGIVYFFSRIEEKLCLE